MSLQLKKNKKEQDTFINLLNLAETKPRCNTIKTSHFVWKTVETFLSKWSQARTDRQNRNLPAINSGVEELQFKAHNFSVTLHFLIAVSSRLWTNYYRRGYREQKWTSPSLVLGVSHLGRAKSHPEGTLSKLQLLHIQTSRLKRFGHLVTKPPGLLSYEVL